MANKNKNEKTTEEANQPSTSADKAPNNNKQQELKKKKERQAREKIKEWEGKLKKLVGKQPQQQNSLTKQKSPTKSKIIIEAIQPETTTMEKKTITMEDDDDSDDFSNDYDKFNEGYKKFNDNYDKTEATFWRTVLAAAHKRAEKAEHKLQLLLSNRNYDSSNNNTNKHL